MDLIHYFYIFMTALASALILVPALRHWALEKGELDVPDGRKVHAEAVPRLGGVAIFTAVLFATLMHAGMTREVRGILAGGLVIFITGLIDDLHGLRPRQKFLGEIAGSLVAIIIGQLYLTRLGDLFGFGPIVLPLWAAIPFTVFAVVGVINAINLIDGLDGLAGGVSIIALATFFLLAMKNGPAPVMAVCAALLGAVLGFLKYNSFPARIFMGDAGSLTVGFLLAILSICLTQTAGASVKPVVPLIILGLPILDTFWVMVRRVLQKISPFTPDRTHVHHQFLELGFDHRFTVIIIYGISLFWALFALLFDRWPEYLLFFTYLAVSIVFYLTLRYLFHHRERFPLLARDSGRGWRQSRFYEEIAWQCEKTVPVLKGIILAYLIIVAIFCARGGGAVAQVSLGVSLASLGLFFFTRDTGNHFLQALVYAAGLMIIFQAEQFDSRTFLWGVTIDGFSDSLFAAAAVLVVLRIIFHRTGEVFLSTPLDFLILAMSLSIVFLPSAFVQSYHLSGVLAKGVILFLALKVLTAREKSAARLLFGAVQAVLLLIVVQGTWG